MVVTRLVPVALYVLSTSAVSQVEICLPEYALGSVCTPAAGLPGSRSDAFVQSAVFKTFTREAWKVPHDITEAQVKLPAVDLHPRYSEAAVDPGFRETGRRWLQLLFPALVLGTCAFACLRHEVNAAARPREESSIAVETAFSVGCFFALIDNLLFTLVIPDSYDLVVTSLGGSMTESGVMVGAFKFGTFCGAVLAFLMIRRLPDLWRNHARRFMLACALLNLAGAASYALVTSATSPAMGPRAKLCARAMLVAGRVVMGLGAGLRLMLVRVLLARLSTPLRRPEQYVRFVFAIMLGIGLGPVISSAVTYSYVASGGSGQSFEAVGLVGVALILGQVGGALSLQPLRYERDFLLEEEEAAMRQLVFTPTEVSRRQRIGAFCLFFACVRGACISGLEAATVVMLELDFGWQRRYTGLAVGIAFLSVIPARMSMMHFYERLPTTQWIGQMVLVSLLGACGTVHYLGFAQGMLGQRLHAQLSSVALLAADSILFSSFFLSDALSQGLIMQHLLPRELSVLNATFANLILTGLQDGVGRSVGPPLARYLVSVGGQNLYAALQILCSLLAFTLANRGFIPLVERGPKRSEGS